MEHLIALNHPERAKLRSYRADPYGCAREADLAQAAGNHDLLVAWISQAYLAYDLVQPAIRDEADEEFTDPAAERSS